MSDPSPLARRLFLRHTARLAAAGAGSALSLPGQAATPGARALALVHTHTLERIDLVYAVDDRYVPRALELLNHFLRDHYTGDVGSIDPRVFDQLNTVQRALGSTRPYEVICGYRCAATNERLRRTRGGGVAARSLHMEGRAVDVRLPDMPLADLRDAALALRQGGVGYYPNEQFVHLDTGRVRTW